MNTKLNLLNIKNFCFIISQDYHKSIQHYRRIKEMQIKQLYPFWLIMKHMNAAQKTGMLILTIY